MLFFSDGGVYRNKEIERELRAVVTEPIFWQFVGLGRAGFGLLERFDTLPGRTVDNVGFFAVDDVNKVPDAAALRQAPLGVRVIAARGLGIIRA